MKFSPGCDGYVVRSSRPVNGREHISWWYGPDHGWGTTYGGLDGSVEVWTTKRLAEVAIRSVYGKVSRHFTVERAANATTFAIDAAQRRKTDVLAGDRPDRASIAAANDATITYLSGDGPPNGAEAPQASTARTANSTASMRR